MTDSNVIKTKAALFGAVKRKSKTVPVPGTKKTLTLYELELPERAILFADRDKSIGNKQVCALAVCLSCDLLTEADAKKLAEQSSEIVLSELANHVLELSGLEVDSVEEAEKNSESGQS